MPILRCWNHLWGSVERWLKSKGGRKEDIGFYSDSLRQLFLQPTKESYDMQLKIQIEGTTIVPPWKEEFKDYFDTHIAPEIECIAAYAVKPIVG